MVGELRCYDAREASHGAPYHFPRHNAKPNEVSCPRQSCIGLEEVADGIWPIYFGRVLLARSDERDYILRD